jgi:hypothetical protein
MIIAGKVDQVLNWSGRLWVSGGASGRRRLRNACDAVANLKPHRSNTSAEFF